MTTNKKNSDPIREYFSSVGIKGGKVRNKKKAEAARRNLAMARLNRWKNRVSPIKKKEDSPDGGS